MSADQSDGSLAPWSISEEALTRWGTLESSDPIILELTRRDLDNLLLGLMGIINFDASLISAVWHMSNHAPTGDVVAILEQARSDHNDAVQRISNFITSVMTSSRVAGE